MQHPHLRGEFRTDVRARAAYSEGAGIHRIVPAAVARPADVDDLAALVRWAATERVALVPRGAGSSMGGGSVGPGVVVDLTGLAPRELAIDPSRRLARASAGISLGELNTAAAAHGLRLPLDPSSARWATLGGLLATNAAGARTLRFGPMRAWVVALAGVTADGEVVTMARGSASSPAAAVRRFHGGAARRIRASRAGIAARFPTTRKNTCGYALDQWLASGDDLDLVVGSEGTLLLVTEATWRLDPIPAERRSAIVEVPSLDALGPLLLALHGARPSALELLDRTFLDVVRRDPPPGIAVPDAEAVVLVELEGDDRTVVEAAAAVVEGAARTAGARATIATDAAREAALWALRHAASPILARLPESTRSMQVVEDGCVPLDRLGDYLRLLRGAAARRGLDIVLFGHAGDGHVHANLLPDTTRSGWSSAVAELFAEVSDGVIALGGTPSGEHGDGRLRAGLVAPLYGPELVALFGEVKAAFDPLCILNPGVILPADEAAPLTALKVGADAAAIPADIAAALRRIERTGGYAESRMELAGE
ncbi:MAG: FAD-binding oxidoreductase [Gemmatimonadales bacterium]|nr:FAD-binding oxidoreductase [Gemmatimonadales bacterium]